MHHIILLAALASTASASPVPQFPWPLPGWGWPPKSSSSSARTSTKTPTPSVTTTSTLINVPISSARVSITSASVSIPSVSVSASVSAGPISASISAGPASPTGAVPPKVKSTTYLANVTDPGLDRDSCGSARIGGRAIWTCRDTLVWNSATLKDDLPLIQNTAGWTDWSASNGPKITPPGQAPLGCGSNGKNSIHQMYGQNTTYPTPYYPLASDMCPTSGLCSDNSRWVYWPDLPPMITTNQTASSTSATGYTWIEKKHLNGLTQLNPHAPFTLFKTTWSGGSALPTTSVVQDQFWKAGEIGFGAYGNVVRNGYAYLYGQNSASQVLLARVLIGSIENRSAYQYWNNGNWSSTMPSLTNTNSVIPNAGGGGQGTFYYSSYFGRYLWIGQALYDVNANFYMTYASSPEGPWSSLTQIFQGINAQNSTFGAYSLQAHPALLPSNTATESGIYLTWSIPLSPANSANGTYLTPLVYLQWQ